MEASPRMSRLPQRTKCWAPVVANPTKRKRSGNLRLIPLRSALAAKCGRCLGGRRRSLLGLRCRVAQRRQRRVWRKPLRDGASRAPGRVARLTDVPDVGCTSRRVIHPGKPPSRPRGVDRRFLAPERIRAPASRRASCQNSHTLRADQGEGRTICSRARLSRVTGPGHGQVREPQKRRQENRNEQ